MLARKTDRTTHLHSVHAQVVTYDYEQDHEKALQLLELCHALQLDDDWRADHAWLCSSFRRHAVLYRIHVCALKLALLLIYAALRTQLRPQAVLFWVVISVWTGWVLVWPPYRCTSSNVFNCIVQCALWLVR